MRIALFQPDIAGNVGTILRLAACFGIACDIIEPCGFAYSDRALRRAGMDYAAKAQVKRHVNWAAFEQFATHNHYRIVLLSSKASVALPVAAFTSNDILLMGSETAGAPQFVHDRAEYRVHIPMQPGFRSLNISVATGIALAEALRQTNGFSDGATP